eukprot:3509546-Pyramimonas_sp.AAC.1
MGRWHCGGAPTSLVLPLSVFGMRFNEVCAFRPQVLVPGTRLLRCVCSAVGRRGGIACSRKIAFSTMGVCESSGEVAGRKA